MIGMKIAIIFMAIAVTSVPANADHVKGKILGLHENMSYSECESWCDNNPDCMNFEYCPRYNQVSELPVPKMCRIFDAKIWDTRNLKQVQWYDCSAYYATCKKGITPNKI